MLWKPHLTLQHAEGTQPCSAQDIMWSGAKRNKSNRERERERAKQLIYMSGSSYMRGELTWQYFCLAALHHRKWSNRSLTEGVTRKTWLTNKHAGVFGTVITLVCNAICSGFFAVTNYDLCSPDEETCHLMRAHGGTNRLLNFRAWWRCFSVF